MSAKKRHFVHEVGLASDGAIVAMDRDERGTLSGTRPFDASLYSRMKHGDPAAIRAAARELFEKIAGDPALSEELLEHPAAITNSSRTVPTTSFLIMQRLVEDYWNPHLERRGRPPVEHVKSDRASEVSQGDYGVLDRARREMRMARRKAFFKPENREKLRGRKVVLFDDLVATGTYERNQRELLKSAGVKEEDIIPLYWIQIEERTAREHPEFEARLNYASIHQLEDLLPFFRDPKLVINARVIKYILPITDEAGTVEGPKRDKLKRFLIRLAEEPEDEETRKLGRHTLLKLYQAAGSSDGYWQKERFRAGFRLLEDYLFETGILSSEKVRGSS